MTSHAVCLAIESATPVASVALMREDRVLIQEEGPSGQHHSENLLPMIDRCLLTSDLSLADVDFFAISIGPGAFTSLRIGLATLKGLAFGRDQLVAPISTLQALALSAQREGRLEGDRPVVPLLDARRGEVYAAAYAVDQLNEPQPAERLASSVYSPENLIRALPEGAQWVGPGVEVIGSLGASEPPGLFSRESGEPSLPNAVSVGLLGRARLEAGQAVTADSLVPRYVRRAEAEAQRISRPLE